MPNPIPKNIYQAIVDKLRRAEAFEVTLKGTEGKIVSAAWAYSQAAQPEAE